MTTTLTAAQAYYLTAVSTQAANVQRAAQSVIGRATEARDNIRKGGWATMPGYSVLGQSQHDLEAAAARLEALLTQAHILDLPDGALEEAVSKSGTTGKYYSSPEA